MTAKLEPKGETPGCRHARIWCEKRVVLHAPSSICAVYRPEEAMKRRTGAGQSVLTPVPRSHHDKENQTSKQTNKRKRSPLYISSARLSSLTSLHSRLRSVRFLTPGILQAQRLSEGVRKETAR